MSLFQAQDEHRCWAEAILKFLGGSTVDVNLALGNPVCSAVLLSLSAENDPVAPASSGVGATCESGTYESDVVSEPRTKHRVAESS